MESAPRVITEWSIAMKMIITIIAIIVLLVAAAPQNARAQANIFTLTNIVFDDGTQASGQFTVVGGAIPFFKITTSAVGSGKGKGGEIQYCYASSNQGPIPPNLSCPGPQAIGGLGLTLAQTTASGPASPENSSVYFLSPYGSVLTFTSPGLNIVTTILPYDAFPKSFSLCVQGVAGAALPSNGTCDKPYGYPWVGGSPGKYLADFLSSEVFFPTFVPGVGYRQAAGRGVVSGTLSGCGALQGTIQVQNGTVEEYLCNTNPSGAGKTTAPK
jgi:hypothetical protein